MIKSKATNKHKNDLAFLDMLFNFTMAFAFLFILAMLLIRPIVPPVKPGVEMKAEFIMNMTWPDNNIDDIDLWVMLPDGRVVNYISKDVEYVTLDRDDRGAMGDVYTGLSSERMLIKLNRETVSIRAIVPGKYVVAAHVFAVYSEFESFTSKTVLPYHAKLELIKLNPRIQVIANAKVRLSEDGQESTFLSFEVTKSGEIINIKYNPTGYSLVTSAFPSSYNNPSARIDGP